MPTHTRTLFVLFGKRALWLLAGLLTVVLIIVARINAGDDHSRIILSGAGGAPKATDPATMLHPRYQGLDSRNRPFNIIADRALQPDTDTVVLSNVSMDMTLDDNSWAALTANEGHYHVASRKLQLDGDVHLFFEGGYEFQTDHAEVNAADGSAHGESVVHGQGTSGTLKSDRFTILQHGAIVWFLGNVHVKLYL